MSRTMARGVAADRRPPRSPLTHIQLAQRPHAAGAAAWFAAHPLGVRLCQRRAWLPRSRGTFGGHACTSLSGPVAGQLPAPDVVQAAGTALTIHTHPQLSTGFLWQRAVGPLPCQPNDICHTQVGTIINNFHFIRSTTIKCQQP